MHLYLQVPLQGSSRTGWWHSLHFLGIGVSRVKLVMDEGVHEKRSGYPSSSAFPFSLSILPISDLAFSTDSSNLLSPFPLGGGPLTTFSDFLGGEICLVFVRFLGRFCVCFFVGLCVSVFVSLVKLSGLCIPDKVAALSINPVCSLIGRMVLLVCCVLFFWLCLLIRVVLMWKISLYLWAWPGFLGVSGRCVFVLLFPVFLCGVLGDLFLEFFV